MKLKEIIFFDKNNILINPFDEKDNEKTLAKYQCGIDNGVSFWKEEDMTDIFKYITETYTKDFIPLFRKNLKIADLGGFLLKKEIKEKWENKKLIKELALLSLKNRGDCNIYHIYEDFLHLEEIKQILKENDKIQ